MLIVGYCFGIRSERRLCEEAHLNLAYRWFCRPGLEDAVPEHSTFSKNRHGRFRESDALLHVFETVLRRCMSEGLVGGGGFGIDASVVKADAARAIAIPGAEIDLRAMGLEQASRAVRGYLEGLDADGRPETMRKSITVTDPAAGAFDWWALSGFLGLAMVRATREKRAQRIADTMSGGADKGEQITGSMRELHRDSIESGDVIRPCPPGTPPPGFSLDGGRLHECGCRG